MGENVDVEDAPHHGTSRHHGYVQMLCCGIHIVLVNSQAPGTQTSSQQGNQIGRGTTFAMLTR